MRKRQNANIYHIFTILFAMALTGCASGPLPQAYSGRTTVVSIPQINVQASAEIGQTIISKTNVTRISAIKIMSDASEAVNYPGTTTLRATIIPLFASNENGKFYRDDSATFTMLGTTVPYKNAGIFIPNEKTKPALLLSK